MRRTTRLRKLRRKLKLRRSLFLMVGALFVALFFGLAANAYMHHNDPKRLITIYDRGMKRTILAPAETVQGALTIANISLAPEDIVEPVATSKLTGTDVVINIYRARLIIVADGAVREKVMTPAQTPDKMLADADLPALGTGDKATLTQSGNIVTDGTNVVLTVTRADAPSPKQMASFHPLPGALSRAKSAQQFTDSKGVVHRETYYDLLMNVVMRACGGGNYTIRADGAKIDKDGYILIAANLAIYPRCSVVETSMGPGKVYDTGGFVKHHPYGFDIATDWTNYDGR